MDRLETDPVEALRKLIRAVSITDTLKGNLANVGSRFVHPHFDDNVSQTLYKNTSGLSYSCSVILTPDGHQLSL